MNDPSITARAQSAFRRARGKAFMRAAWSMLMRRPNRLLAYDEVREKLRAGGPVYRGMESVPIDQIVGSVNRFRDFDRAFLPSQDFTEERWKNIGRAYYEDVNLPPVKLYQVGDAYFVVDGNHRVSVARELGRAYIDAEVQECRVLVPLTPHIRSEDLEVIGEAAQFLEQTQLAESRPDATITTTIPGGYHLLLEHIEVHRYLQSQEWSREFSFHEAAAQWYDQVYKPFIEVIAETKVLDEFPGRTETDLYVWLMDHLFYLRERFGERISPRDAARSFAAQFTPHFLKRFWTWLTHFFRRPPNEADTA
jgi:hypothetical protein